MISLKFPDAVNVFTLIATPTSQTLAQMVTHCKLQIGGRALAVGRAGYIALVPEETAPADVICHILGCRWPVVLRPAGEQYRVVGHAYVDGGNDRVALLGPMLEGYRGIALYDAPTAKWWPMYPDEVTGKPQIEDPRLGDLPKGWKVAGHEEGRLWNWYVRDDNDAGEREVKRERRWRSDPRLGVEAL